MVELFAGYLERKQKLIASLLRTGLLLALVIPAPAARSGNDQRRGDSPRHPPWNLPS